MSESLNDGTLRVFGIRITGSYQANEFLAELAQLANVSLDDFYFFHSEFARRAARRLSAQPQQPPYFFQ
jgi:hypothetical protein